MKNNHHLSLFDLFGDWKYLDVTLVERIHKAWKKPLAELTNRELAALLRQRFAVEYVLPLARQRIIEDYDDDSDGPDGELEEVVEQIDLEDSLQNQTLFTDEILRLSVMIDLSNLEGGVLMGDKIANKKKAKKGKK